MTEDWHHARLIPTSGINGADEQERRAATALLAVIGAVGPFGRALTRPLGAPEAAIDTFIEVPFTVRGRICRPDGLIQVRDGARRWTALVEVRTGNSELDAAQLETYRELAREQGFDVVLTISNGPGPEAANGMGHCSWREVLAAAEYQQQRSAVDPNQAWLLGELIRYLEHPRSGVLEVKAAGKGPVRSIDLRDPTPAGLRTVLVGESALRLPPIPPTRRDLRLVRRLPALTGPGARSDAGWYVDPDDPSQLRWWDGVGWTDGRYPAQPALTVGDV
jgi:uncharacterized protein DUF2510